MLLITMQLPNRIPFRSVLGFAVAAIPGNFPFDSKM